MPLSLEPDRRFPVVLEIDKDKPSETQPTFYANSKSMRDAEDTADEFDAMLSDSQNGKELHKRTCEMLHKHVVGWKNMGNFTFPTSPQEWYETGVLTFAEAAELLRGIIRNRSLNVDEKKS